MAGSDPQKLIAKADKLWAFRPLQSLNRFYVVSGFDRYKSKALLDLEIVVGNERAPMILIRVFFLSFNNYWKIICQLNEEETTFDHRNTRIIATCKLWKYTSRYKFRHFDSSDDWDVVG